jgi:hypothetical protein
MNVYECIAAVSGEIAKEGISKARNNQQQGYNFRGIDDVYNALAPVLAKHKLVIVPRVENRDVVERHTRNGGALFYVTVAMEFDFVSAADGSKTTARTYGEAMDSGDKATNKAMSAAYKYACMQTFCIPTEGDNDADAKTHEVATPKPEGYDNWVLDFELAAEGGIAALQEAFKTSKVEYRLYRTRFDNERHEALKAKAAKVGQARKAETVAT